MTRAYRAVFVGLAVLVAACAGQPARWTPEKVAVPPAASAGIETPAPLEQRAELVQASDTTEPVKLSRDGALLTALKNNQSIEVARFGPQIGETLAPEARAAFDPVLLGAVSTGRSNAQQQSGRSSSNFSGASSGSSGAATSVGQALNQLQGSLSTIDNLLAPTNLETKSTQGSVTIQETLPTGTQLSVTGNGTASDTNLSGNEYQGAWTVNATQPLLAGAGTAVNLVALRQARNRAAQSLHAFRGSVLGIVEQTELAYWGLVLAREVVKIREFAVTLADEQLRRNDELLRVGKAIEGDVIAARAEKASRTADLADAQGSLRTQTVALIRLLNPAGAEPWHITFDPVDPADATPMPVDTETSAKTALQFRPELAQARLDLANSDLDVTRAKNGLLPHLDLVGSYGKTSQGVSQGGLTKYLGDSGYEDYQIGLQLQTPILYRGERARYERARLTAAQQERIITNLEQGVSSDVRQAAVQVQKQAERLESTRVAVESRKEQLRIAQGRNAVGKTTNLDLLLVQRDLIQAEVDDATARVGYIQAVTTLYGSEGTLLERRGITLETDEKRP